MNTLQQKKILVGISGGIAAYKVPDLIRRLREENFLTRVVMTAAAQQFITPLTLQAVSGNPVHTSLLDPASEAAMGHIELARWSDLIVIVPASADFMAHLSYGFANDLLSTLCLATTAPILLAPAMNQQMWLNPITQENINRLRTHRITIVGPAEGSQACGEYGPGRMLEPLELLQQIKNCFAPKFLKGKTVMVTAGPTRELIDPVRYLSNRSSGKMGIALAEAAYAADADVKLVLGPTSVTPPAYLNCFRVETAEQMLQAVHQNIENCDVFISAAAVADYRPEKISPQKIKKNESKLTLNLIKNEDILASVARLPQRPFVVGFAAETENLVENAQKKLQTKKLNMVIANLVNKKESGFESDQNECTVLWKNGQQEFPLMSKKQMASELIKLISSRYYEKNSTQNS